MSVPKEMQGKYEEIGAILKEYCAEHLDEEYESLCLHALEKLCRKRPSPLLGGKPNTWAAGIVYAIGSNNFIFDKSQSIHMTAKELVAPFGLSTSTASAKGAEIKKMLRIDIFKAEWCLQSRIENNTMIWMVEVNGIPFDARYLTEELQVMCYERGLIPYVPAHKHQQEQDEDEESATKRVKRSKKA